MRGDLLQRREPHAARRLHMLDECGDGVGPRHAAGHERMPHGDPDPAVLVGGVELRAEDLHRALGRRDRKHVAKVLQADVLRPVVERQIGRQLHRRAGAVGQEVRDVVALERGVVLDALVEQEAQGVTGERVGRGAESARPAARGLHDGVDPALEGDTLVVLGELVELFVHVAVVAELMSRGQDGVDRLRVRLDAPAGDEERLPELVACEEVEQARHRHLGVVAQHRRHRHAVRRRVRKVEMHQALGVHVEGECHRAACALRPGDRVLDHGLALPRAILRPPAAPRNCGVPLTRTCAVWLGDRARSDSFARRTP
jgi:hypothetical protein